MKYLIDGYNLLHQSPVMQTGSGAKWLEQQRDRLVHSLAELLTPSDRENTVVVFDAHSGPSASTVDKTIEGIRVRFAHHYLEADDLIESMIEAHPNPQSLIVVSSDRRLQRAARSRRAKSLDGREWFDALSRVQTDSSLSQEADPEDIKNSPVEPGQIEKWIQALGLDKETSPSQPVSTQPVSTQRISTQRIQPTSNVRPLSKDDTELKDSDDETQLPPTKKRPRRRKR